MTIPKYKIDLYTICYNEEKIIPFVINYWKYLQVNHVYVANNNSTDKSVELLSQYPDWITIKTYNDNVDFNDKWNNDYKNNIWKGSDADFVIICDMDECIYSKDFISNLDYMMENDVDVCTPIGTNVYSYRFPILFNPNMLVHELNSIRFKFCKFESKQLIFRPDKVKEINYTMGAHDSKPIRYDNSNCKVIGGKSFKIPMINLHLKMFGLDYILFLYHRNASRLSEINKKHNWGWHYTVPDDSIRNMFEQDIKSAQTFKNYYRNLLKI